MSVVREKSKLYDGVHLVKKVLSKLDQVEHSSFEAFEQAAVICGG